MFPVRRMILFLGTPLLLVCSRLRILLSLDFNDNTGAVGRSAVLAGGNGTSPTRGEDVNNASIDSSFIKKISKKDLLDDFDNRVSQLQIPSLTTPRQPSTTTTTTTLSRLPTTAVEIATKYGIPKTPRQYIHCSNITQIGWIPTTVTVDNSDDRGPKSKIPRYIFQSWKTNMLKPKLCANVLQWIDLNPEYDYFLFDDEASARFIKQEYGSQIHDAYKCVKVGAARCDIWRLLIIYLLGGIYFDFDVRPKSSFESWGFHHDPNRTVVTGRACKHMKGGCAHQWGLIYTPQHEVIQKAITETLINLATRNATHVYDVSFWSYFHAWRNSPIYNQSYMPGWGDYMGHRVEFSNVEVKNTMLENTTHWPKAKGLQAIWKSECLV